MLILPDVFEPAFCGSLIVIYEAHGGTDSGFMREIEGKTVDGKRAGCVVEINGRMLVVTDFEIGRWTK